MGRQQRRNLSCLFVLFLWSLSSSSAGGTVVFLVGTTSLFKEPIHFKTLGLHATEYGQVFLTARFFENYVPRTKRRVMRTNWTDLPLTTGSLRNLYMRMPGVNDLFWQLAEGTSNAISASLSLARLTFRHTELIFWHPNDVSGSCHVVFWPRNSKYHFWGQNGTTLKVCKIVNFNPKHLKLWNRAFQTVYFKNRQKNFAS